MDFYKLPTEYKQKLHVAMTDIAVSFGGVNFFLTLIELLRHTKPHPILNESAVFHYDKGKIQWSKSIRKESLTQLFHAINKEYQGMDALQDLSPKEHKAMLNMIKALKSVTFSVSSKDASFVSFDFNLFESQEKENNNLSLVFKTLFFYPFDFIKKSLQYKNQEI
jgi:predicted lipoprotein